MTSSREHNRHQTDYRYRVKKGLKPALKPWYWLSLADVQKLAKEAYMSATHQLSDIDSLPDDPYPLFVEVLSEAFNVLVAASAQEVGVRCAPANSQHYAKCMRDDLPADWRPQYPVYKQVTPERVCTSPGVVINADEGNVNDTHFK
jgi:hypothetical protein